MAYVAVLEGADEGRTTNGWYLAIAVRNERGYHQCKPGFGPYVDETHARMHAKVMNKMLGNDEEAALMIVLSTMGKNRRVG
jgi:hypothetical protein